MPAWSVPGSQSTFLPFMRCQRIVMSTCAVSNMWPMCKAPVTFGGGMTKENTDLSDVASASNRPSLTHRSAHAGSMREGS